MQNNTLEENIEAVKKSGAKMIIAHDFLSHEELNRYRREAAIRGAELVSPIRSAMRTGLPDYCWNYLESLYTDYPAYGPYTMSWEALWQSGDQFTGKVEAPKILIDRYSGLIQALHGSVKAGHSFRAYDDRQYASDEFLWCIFGIPTDMDGYTADSFFGGGSCWMLLMPLASDKC